MHAAYVNGVALFAYQYAANWWSCGVTGHFTAGGSTLEEVKTKGIKYALSHGREEADRVLTRKQFQTAVTNPTKL